MPGDVAERAVLDAALADRPGRLALEVDDHEVATRVQHLAEVEVAVGADAHGVDAPCPQHLEPRAARRCPATTALASTALASSSRRGRRRTMVSVDRSWVRSPWYSERW